jgi:hypothetical protein
MSDIAQKSQEGCARVKAWFAAEQEVVKERNESVERERAASSSQAAGLPSRDCDWLNQQALGREKQRL